MPLAWAHAEFIKLMVSRRIGYPLDRPEAVWTRYGGRHIATKHAIWCLHAPIDKIEHGTALIIALPRAARIHWGVNGWQNITDNETADTGLGIHSFELNIAVLSQARRTDFTFQWLDTGEWAHGDFHVTIG